MGVTSDTQGILFAKVPGAEEVYFGEYIELNAAPNDPQHTVFYVGENATTALPSGEADYQITGINNYDGTADSLLVGGLNVDFNSAALIGQLTRGTSGTNVANTIVFGGTIDNTTAAFSGSAIANGSVAGDLHGQFFGDGAAAVAGALTFDGNRNLDTAFGGTKVGP